MIGHLALGAQSVLLNPFSPSLAKQRHISVFSGGVHPKLYLWNYLAFDLRHRSLG